MSKNKKTRKEKIISDLRRQIHSQEARNFPQSQSVSIDENKISNYKIAQTSSTIPTSPTPTNIFTINTGDVKKDLTKTFILAILALSFEFVIYFLAR